MKSAENGFINTSRGIKDTERIITAQKRHEIIAG
jgi:hypothetical protein